MLNLNKFTKKLNQNLTNTGWDDNLLERQLA